MKRAIVVIGTVVAVLIGVGIAGAQTPTPTPTRTPTPVEKACEQFDWAVWEAWWGTIANDEDNAQYHKDLAGRLKARLSWTMALKDTDPAMERMVSPLYWTFRARDEGLSSSAFRYRFDRMLIGARQIERVCFARGHEKAFDVPVDVLAEYACVDHRFVNDQLSPRFESVVWDCEIIDFNSHTHDSWDDQTHTHRQLHSHSGW